MAKDKKTVKKRSSSSATVEAPKNNPHMRRLNGKLLRPGKKKQKEHVQGPLRMKKNVAKPRGPIGNQEFVNTQQDFAYAFAESMKAAARAQTETPAVRPQQEVIKLSRRPVTRKQGEKTLKFSNRDLEQFRKMLLTLRDTVVGKTRVLKNNALEQTIDRAGEDEDGSDSFMRLQNLGQANEQNKILQKIDEALRHIDNGTYGVCDVCGQLIRKQRLMHLPFAHTCMECQSAMEAR